MPESPKRQHTPDLNCAGKPVSMEPFTEALRQHFPSKEALLAEAAAQTNSQKKRQRYAKKTAGVILPILLIGGVIWADPAVQHVKLSAAIGEQMHYTLTDGSLITLNTNSELTLEQRLRTRSMVLNKGEAAFTVAQHWKPFIVHSGNTRIRDIGTAFTVRQLPEGNRITVLDGIVEISSINQSTQPDFAAPITLRQGQSVLTPATHTARVTDASAADLDQAEIEDIDTTAAQTWQKGRIVFNNTPLIDVVKELQRYRAGQIQIADARIEQLKLSGVYDINRIEALISALPQALPIQLQKGVNGDVLISPKSATSPNSNNKNTAHHQ